MSKRGVSKWPGVKMLGAEILENFGSDRNGDSDSHSIKVPKVFVI